MQLRPHTMGALSAMARDPAWAFSLRAAPYQTIQALQFLEQEEKNQILHDNVAELYHLSL